MTNLETEDITVIRFTVPSSDDPSNERSPTTASSAIFQLRLGLCIAFLLIAIGLYLILIHPMATDNVPFGSGIENKLDITLNTEKEKENEYDIAYGYLNDTRDRHQIPLFNLPLIYKLEFKFFLPWKSSINFGDQNYLMIGKSQMIFTVAKTNKRVQVHTLDLHIGEVRVEDDIGRVVPVEEINRDSPHVLDIYTTNMLVENMNYTLHVSFTGKVSRQKRVGIFSSQYTARGEERHLISTHCQTQHARSVFPCIDNPEAKARFQVKVIHPYGTSAVSNGMESNITTEGDWTTTFFESSPVMSTYLFALAVSDYAFLETMRNGVRLRVYVPSTNVEDASLAMDNLPRILDFYEDYFQMSCPIDKLGKYKLFIYFEIAIFDRKSET
ncbi:unnamed protein product [Auanema sp. JU1783]|nr:unnamed protein product [Auanema sp. JU1783]